MNLPFPIQAYFDADAQDDRETLVQAFAPDAVVKDEGNSHAGHQAIGAWWRETKDKYQTLIEPMGLTEEGDGATVLAKVSGQFPGSPAMLVFRFQFDGDRISHLEIGA